MKRRVLVTGSRTWKDFGVILQTLSRFDPETTTLVHGSCHGADGLADTAAAFLDWPHVERRPADWKTHGRKAGPIRNRAMVESLNPERDIVLAFWDGESRGTLNTIELARDRGLTVKVYRPDGSSY